MKRVIVIALVLVPILALSSLINAGPESKKSPFELVPAYDAKDIGRFQVVNLGSTAEATFGSQRALILDTSVGHLWIWEKFVDSEEEIGVLIYQGMALPAKKMGEHVDYYKTKKKK